MTCESNIIAFKFHSMDLEVSILTQLIIHDLCEKKNAHTHTHTRHFVVQQKLTERCKSTIIEK